MHWPAPEVDSDVAHDRGPVMVTIEYKIDTDALDDFSAAMANMRRIRVRDGAIQWGLYQDAADPTLVVEFFTVESWLEHLRQHDRVTHTDKLDQDVVHALFPEAQGGRKARRAAAHNDRPLMRHACSPPFT